LPPPRLAAPPPPFVPPPEVQIQATPPQQPTITATPVAPPEPATIAPVAPTRPAVEAPSATAPVAARVVCSNYASVMDALAYPRDAIRMGLERGDATVQFTVDPSGAIKDVRVVGASHPIFARASLRIVGEYRCQGQGRDVLVQVPFGYRLE